ncbi:hypothetical protein IFM89_033947 [Coptis chinensis]|uniref:Uncharacterized protein n=1 Tax=Coptis chinensis TaxID=261450 RepID=A0A835LY16_9MAGN|nr:hypothetical protein IFM89_033947 [Coptis chinensis]
MRCWDLWNNHVLSFPHRGRKVKYSSECNNKYFAWYPFVTQLVVMNPEHLESFNIEDPTYELYDVLEETGRMIQRGLMIVLMQFLRML